MRHLPGDELLCERQQKLKHKNLEANENVTFNLSSFLKLRQPSQRRSLQCN
jgi:hypothetical protein